jgi:hypothetical protein
VKNVRLGVPSNPGSSDALLRGPKLRRERSLGNEDAIAVRKIAEIVRISKERAAEALSAIESEKTPPPLYIQQASPYL